MLTGKGGHILCWRCRHELDHFDASLLEGSKLASCQLAISAGMQAEAGNASRRWRLWLAKATLAERAQEWRRIKNIVWPCNPIIISVRFPVLL